MSSSVPPPQTRFVNSTKYRSRTGSIHNDVPVKPTCPNARADIRAPHDEVGSIVSHPSARELPGTVLFVVNVRTRSASNTLACPPSRRGRFGASAIARWRLSRAEEEEARAPLIGVAGASLSGSVEREP